MIVIDTEPLVLFIVGTINKDYILRNKRTSIYSKVDYELLKLNIGNVSNLIIPPNVWTETDNLLNNIEGKNHFIYYEILKNFISNSSEQYIKSNEILFDITLNTLGITDTVLLKLAKSTGKLITADSKLSDYAKSKGIKVYDLKEVLNSRL